MNLPCLLLSVVMLSSDPNIVPIWPAGKIPGQVTASAELSSGSANDLHYMNVSVPTLTVYLAPGSDAHPVPAMIVCPGGGYRALAWAKEGIEVAKWLNSIGISAFVLKYRVPDNREGAFQDVQRAVRLVRARAAEWNVGQVGIIGFSAGGHVAARLATGFDQAAYAPVDAVDSQSCRPDFAILVYPAYLQTNGKLSPEFTLNSKTPPILIVHNKDDKAYEPGSVVFDAALSAANLPHKFLLYDTGGHGYGLRSQLAVKVWPDDTQAWLKEIGVLPKGDSPSGP